MAAAAVASAAWSASDHSDQANEVAELRPCVPFTAEKAAVEEAVVCGEGKDYLVALIFTENKLARLEIAQTLPKIGEGFHRVGNFAILGTQEIISTPTGKTKRKALIEKFGPLIKEL